MDKLVCQVLNYNDYETTIKLVDRVKNYSIFEYVLIVDNHSNNNSKSILEKYFSNYENIVVISTMRNGGYGYGNNYGLKYAFDKLKAKYVLITNPDVKFKEKMIKHLVEAIQLKKAAIVSGVQYIHGKEIYDKAWKIPSAYQWTFAEIKYFSKRIKPQYHYKYSDFNDTSITEVDCVPGAMLLVDVAKFLEVGGYDKSIFLFGEETVIGYKLKRKGYKTFLLNKEVYDHQHSVSINKSLKSKIQQLKILHESKLIFYKKYLKIPIYKYFFYKLIFKVIIWKKHL